MKFKIKGTTLVAFALQKLYQQIIYTRQRNLRWGEGALETQNIQMVEMGYGFYAKPLGFKLLNNKKPEKWSNAASIDNGIYVPNARTNKKLRKEFDGLGGISYLDVNKVLGWNGSEYEAQFCRVKFLQYKPEYIKIEIEDKWVEKFDIYHELKPVS